MYSVRVTINDSTTTWKRHIDQIIPRSTATQPDVNEFHEPHLDIEPSHVAPSSSYAPVITREQHPATHGTTSSSNSPPVAMTPPEVQQQPQTRQPASQNNSAAELAPPDIKTSSSATIQTPCCWCEWCPMMQTLRSRSTIDAELVISINTRNTKEYDFFPSSKMDYFRFDPWRICELL